MPFVNVKHPDLHQIAELLEASRREKRYANFGPVARALGEAVLRHNGHVEGRAAIGCANATLGLAAAAGTLSVRAGRRLRWVVSAFGFFSTYTGCFADARIIDCGDDGLIDLDRLERLSADSFDGIVVTNPFGLVHDFAPFFDWCADRGKALIFDNAAGFGLWRGDALLESSASVEWIEVVSFHHTKPFGMGEGGAAVVPLDAHSAYEGMLNFGVGLPKAFRSFFTNGKLSDLAAAAILARVSSAAAWRPSYLEQARRIIDLGRRAGLRPWLDRIDDRATPGHIPFLAPGPISLDRMANPILVLGKYYLPADPTCVTATALFQRMVNVPCHPDVALLSDDQILSALSGIARASAA